MSELGSPQIHLYVHWGGPSGEVALQTKRGLPVYWRGGGGEGVDVS